ncbi:hypothetical protein WA158_002936 [Blastocystis sp. Blastoise]
MIIIFIREAVKKITERVTIIENESQDKEDQANSTMLNIDDTIAISSTIKHTIKQSKLLRNKNNKKYLDEIIRNNYDILNTNILTDSTNNLDYIHLSYCLYLYKYKNNVYGFFDEKVIDIIESMSISINKIDLNNKELLNNLCILLEYSMNISIENNHNKLLFNDDNLLHIIQTYNFYIHRLISLQDLDNSIHYFINNKLFDESMIEQVIEKRHLDKNSIQLYYYLCHFPLQYLSIYHSVCFYPSIQDFCNSVINYEKDFNNSIELTIESSRKYKNLQRTDRSSIYTMNQCLTKEIINNNAIDIDIDNKDIDKNMQCVFIPGSTLKTQDIEFCVRIIDIDRYNDSISNININNNNDKIININPQTNLYKDIYVISDLERFIIQAPYLCLFDKLSIISPYFFTDESIIIRDILNTKRWTDYIEEVLSLSKSFNDIYTNMKLLEEKHMENQLEEKNNNIQHKIDSINGITKKMALLKENYFKKLNNYIELVNEKIKYNNNLYKSNEELMSLRTIYINIYSTYLYHFSWNSLMDNSIVQLYNRLTKEQLQSAYKLLLNFNNKYYSITEPVKSSFMEVAFIPYMENESYLTYTFDLYYKNTNILAPIQMNLIHEEKDNNKDIDMDNSNDIDIDNNKEDSQYMMNNDSQEILPSSLLNNNSDKNDDNNDNKNDNNNNTTYTNHSIGICRSTPMKSKFGVQYHIIPMPSSTYDVRIRILNRYYKDEQENKENFNNSDSYPFSIRYRYVQIPENYNHTSLENECILLLNLLLQLSTDFYAKNTQFRYDLSYFDKSFNTVCQPISIKSNKEMIIENDINNNSTIKRPCLDIHLFNQIEKYISKQDIKYRYTNDYTDYLPLYKYINPRIDDMYHIEIPSLLFLSHYFNSNGVCSLYLIPKNITIDINEFNNINSEEVLSIKNYHYFDIINILNYIPVKDELSTLEYGKQEGYVFTDKERIEVTQINKLCNDYMKYYEEREVKSKELDVLKKELETIKELSIEKSLFVNTNLIENTIELSGQYNFDENNKQSNINDPDIDIDQYNMNNNIINNSKLTNILYDCIVICKQNSIPCILTPMYNNLPCIYLPDKLDSYHDSDLYIPLINPYNYPIRLYCDTCDVTLLDKGIHIHITSDNNNNIHNIHKHILEISCEMSTILVSLIYKENNSNEIIKTGIDIGIFNDNNQRLLYIPSKEVSIYYKQKNKTYKQNNKGNAVYFEDTGYILFFNQQPNQLYKFFIFNDNGHIEPYIQNIYENEIIIQNNMFNEEQLWNNFKQAKTFIEYFIALKELKFTLFTNTIYHQYTESLYNYILEYKSMFLPSVIDFIQDIFLINDTSNSSSNNTNTTSNNNSISTKYRLFWTDKIRKESVGVINNFMVQDKSNNNNKFGSHYKLTKRVESVEQVDDIMKNKENDTKLVYMNKGDTIDDSISATVKEKAKAFIVQTIIDDVDISELNNEKNEEKDKELENRLVENTTTIGSNQVYRQYCNMSLDDYVSECLVNNKDSLSAGILKTDTIIDIHKDEEKNNYMNSENRRKELKYITILKPIISHWTNEIRSSVKNNQYQYRKRIVLVIDTNFTHKEKKAQFRTLLGTIIILLCKELDIPLALCCTTTRNQGFIICTENDDEKYKISLLNSLSKLKKALSSPLDLFETVQFKNYLEDDNGFIFISDCFSSQLLTDIEGVRKYISDRINNILLLQIVNDTRSYPKDECISNENQQKINELLLKNFNDHCIPMTNSCLFVSPIPLFIDFFYSKEPLTALQQKQVKVVVSKPQFNAVTNLIDSFDLDVDHLVTKDYVVSVGELDQNIEKINNLPSITNEDMNTYNIYNVTTNFVSLVNSKIHSNDLFESLNMLFPPNKPTKYIPSTTGNIINFKEFINYIISGISNGKLFKKKSGNKVRDYSVSIVIDCTTNTFSNVNRSHSLFTLLRLLKGIETLELQNIDIWVCRNQPIKIATGISSDTVLSNNIIGLILYETMKPVRYSCLATSVKFASATASSRPSNCLEIVLTNGVESPIERESLKKVLHSYSNIHFIGVGLGLYCKYYENIFPSFIWSTKFNDFSDALTNYLHNTEEKECKTYYEIPEDLLFSLNNQSLSLVEKMTTSIQDVYSEIDIHNMFYNMKTGNDIYEGLKNIEGNDHDLGIDGSFSNFSVLLVVLYLKRAGNVSEENTQNDPSISEENLNNGPIKKLKEKGFNVTTVFDYYKAIVEIQSGKYRVCMVTCSVGDGILGKEQDGMNYFGYLKAFIRNLRYFYENGGGIFWLLDNFPWTWEFEWFMEDCKDFNLKPKEILDTTIHVDGGKIMTLETEEDASVMDEKERPKEGKFRNSGATQYIGASFKEKLEQGLRSIYEGETLAVLREETLVANGFEVFARETDGARVEPNQMKSEKRYPAILIRESINGRGRMIVDTAQSKLYKEWTTDGTPRYISNGVIWLLNLNKVLMDNKVYQNINADLSKIELPLEVRNLVAMTTNENKDSADFRGKVDIPPRLIEKPQNIIFTIIMDCTSSTILVQTSLKKIILDTLKSLEDRRAQVETKNNSSVRFLLVGYRDYDDNSKRRIVSSDVMNGSDYPKMAELLDSRESPFYPSGGRCRDCGTGCEDMCGGIEKALDLLQDYKNFNHIVVLLGASGMHGINPKCNLKKNGPKAVNSESFDSIWSRVADKVAEFNDMEIHCYPLCDGTVTGVQQSDIQDFITSTNVVFKTHLQNCRKGNTFVNLENRIKVNTSSDFNSLSETFSREFSNRIKDVYAQVMKMEK